MIKRGTVYIFAVAVLIPVGMNLWQTCREIGWDYSAGRYSDFIDMKSRNRTRSASVNFIKKYLEPGKSCYFWDDPQKNDWLVTECLIADVNYYLYPLRMKYGAENLKSGADYIVSEKYNYHDLNLYMVFFDLDKKYAKLAENKKMIILKRTNELIKTGTHTGTPLQLTN